MKWLACLSISFMTMVVAILANYGPFLHSDGQLSELSDHIASRTCHRIEFDHDVNESVDTRGNIIPAIPSNASPDEEAQKEIRKFLVDFSKSPDVVVAKKRHHTESRVTIPLSRLQSQISGNILSKGKKAKLHNDETINKQIVEAALGVSQAEPTNPTSSNKFGSFSGKFTSSLTEKSTQLENKLDTNVGKFLTLSLTSMPEGEPKVNDVTRDFLGSWEKGQASSSAGSHLVSSTNQPEDQPSSRTFHLRHKTPLPNDGSRTGRFSGLMTGKVDSLNLKDAGIALKRNNNFSWGDFLLLKLNEQGESSLDSMDIGEKPHTSQVHLHSKVGKKTCLDDPVLGTSGTFSIHPENEIVSRNQGLLTPELRYNWHLSMMQDLFRKDMAGNSHHNVNTMNSKKEKHEIRLKFDQDLLKGEDEFQEQRNYLEKVFTSIPKPFEGNFMLSTDQLQDACKKLKHSHKKLKSKLRGEENRKIRDYKAIWLKYWKEKEKINFSALKSYKVLKYDFEVIFHIYFILVREILNTLPFKEDQPLYQELHYPQEMEKALKAYLEFTKIIEEHGCDQSGPYEEFIRSILFATQSGAEKSGAIIWKAIEFWMEKDYNGVWKFLKEKNANCISNNAKSVFNGVFKYGFENMTRKIA